MDLQTIKKKLENDSYHHLDGLYADIDLIITNSFKYNSLSKDFIKLTLNFQKRLHKTKKQCERIMNKKNKYKSITP